LETKYIIYISIFVVGTVFAVLTLVLGENSDAALTFFYFTVSLILFIRLVEEWKYFRSHSAPLASVMFVALITPIAIGGSLLARTATLEPIITGLNLQAPLTEMLLGLEFLGIGSFSLFLNLFGLVFAFPFFVLLLLLLRKYFSGRYPVIFVFRKRFPRETLLVYTGSIFIIFGILWWQTRIVEVSALIFVITSTVLFLQYYVFRLVVVPVWRATFIERRSSLNEAVSGINRRLNNNSQVTTRANRASRVRQPNSTRSSRNRGISTASRSSTHNRTASTTPRRATRNHTSTTNINRTARSDIAIVPGINHLEEKRISRERVSPSVLKRLTPVGQHLTEDDFKCILCYEFPIEKRRKVVICPHCKHPAHADEFHKWAASSQLCSRCNKQITVEKMIRISGEKYNKLLKMFKKKQL
jgi:hypothetical protein